ncbi:TPA: hypothetical protein EYO12_02980 [Candidatus Saccharibacteria bacterium]|nr:hypothetical protein [Candidatus Saccharibacteria bacterium]HIO88000.1 hypothetical protein [Candidatus Saccharibacteria bacterium]
MNDDQVDTSKSLDELLGESENEDHQDKKSESTPPKKPQKKSMNKKIIALIAVVILLLGAGYAYMRTGNNQETSDAETTETDQSDSSDAEPSADQVESPFLSYSTVDSYSALNQDGTSETLFDIASNHIVLDTSGAQVAVAQLNANEYDIIGVEFYEGSEETISFTIDESISASFTVVDFESQTLIGLVFDIDGISIKRFSEVNTSGETLYSMAPAGGDLPLAPILAQNGSVLAQRHTCFDCDGPQLGEIWEITDQQTEPKQLFKVPNSEIFTAIDIDLTAAKETIYLTVSDGPFFGDIDSSVAEISPENFIFKIYSYDIDSGESKEVYSVTGPYTHVAGESTNNNEILISIAQLSEVENPDEIRYTGRSNYDAPVINRLNTSTQTVRPLNLTLRKLISGTTVSEALSIGEQLYFALSNPSSSNTEKILYRLDLGETGSGQIEDITTGSSSNRHKLPQLFPTSLQ